MERNGISVVVAAFLVAGGVACSGPDPSQSGGSDAGGSDAADVADTTDVADTGAEQEETETGPEPNEPPTAEAGDDQIVAVGDRVAVDASGSEDPDRDGLSYSWSLESTPDQSSASLTSAENVAAWFTADAAGTFELAVSVTDGEASASDTVSVEARGVPTAEAGPDQTGEVGQTVMFDGSGSKAPSGAPLSHEWSFVSKPEMSSVTFANGSMATATFTPDKPGSYIVELAVSNEAAEATDRATIEVAPMGGRLTSTVYVASDGDDENPGTEEAPLKTVGAAVELAKQTDGVRRIQLGEGTYDVGDSTFDLTDDLDVAGPADDEASAVIKGSADLFNVKGDTFSTFVDVTLESGRDAFDVDDDAGLSLVETTCKAEQCIGSGSFPQSQGGRIEVIRSTLQGHGDEPETAIAATAPDGITVVDSTIRDFPDRGIHVINAAVTVRDTTFRENGTAVELLVNSTANATRIEHARFRKNQTALENVGAKNVVVRETSIEKTREQAVVVNGGAVQLKKTEIRDVLNNAVVAKKDAVVSLRECDIIHNLLDGVRIEGEEANVDLGTASSDGGNVLKDNVGAQVHDARPDGASGSVTMSGTKLEGSEPPSGTYSGPNFENHGIQIENDTEVRVY